MRELQVIRTINGQLRGKLYEDSIPGDQKLYDKNGQMLGRYVKSSDSTFKLNGQKVGYGNILMTLLPV
jgi:hypothetical protein